MISKQSQKERIAPYPVKTWCDLLQDLDEPERGGGEDEDEVASPGAPADGAHLNDADHNGGCGDHDVNMATPIHSSGASPTSEVSGPGEGPGVGPGLGPGPPVPPEVVVATDRAAVRCNDAGWYWLGSLVGEGDEVQGEAAFQALSKMQGNFHLASVVFRVIFLSFLSPPTENGSVVSVVFLNLGCISRPWYGEEYDILKTV